MASGSGPKVRFVKCPKCLRVLLEDEDVPVYQCGGCFTILQAKNRNISANVTQNSAETEGILPSELQNVSEVEGSSSSSPEMVVSSSAEFYEGQEHKNGPNGSVDYIGEESAGVGLSIREQAEDIQRLIISAGDPKQNAGEIFRLEADDSTDEVATEQDPDSGSSSSDHVVAARETTLSVDDSPRQRAGSSPEILHVSPDGEEQSHRNDYSGHQSRDSLTNKTSSAYDGSVSSYDGRENQHPNNAGVSPEKRLGDWKYVMQDHPENKERGTNSSAMISEDAHYGTRYNSRDKSRSQQLGGAGERRYRYWHRQGTQQTQSYLSRYGQGPSFTSAYEHGSRSYHSHDDFESHSRAFSHQMPPYSGHRHSGPGLHWKENHTHGYINHDGFDHMYHDIRYGIRTRARDWGQTSKAACIPFSGESMTNRRYLVGHPSWHSGQLHASYGSYPGSPQRQLEPQYYPGWSHEIVSDVEDQRRRPGHEVQTYPRERRVAKRHVRPTAGAAPFISCCHCSQTLQTPVDFLIFKRKYHFLRCGTCMNILRFSLQDGTRLVPTMRDTRPESSNDINARGSVNLTLRSSRNEVPKPEKRSSSGQNKELPMTRGSPLHRLMGYSTVSQVFKVTQRSSSPKISDYNQTSKN